MLTRWNDLARLSRFGRDTAEASDTFDALRREMNRLFFDFERGFPADAADLASRAWPRVTLEDSGTNLVVRADLPGVAEKDVELTVEGDTLTVKGERKDVAPEGYSVHRKERSAYRFARSFVLPAKVDASAVEAVLKSGVLTVTLPKAKEAQPRQITVRAS